MDGENHIVPLALALVDEESYDSWSWFLRCLKGNVGKNIHWLSPVIEGGSGYDGNEEYGDNEEESDNEEDDGNEEYGGHDYDDYEDVNSDNEVDTDEEMFNGVDLGNDEKGMNVSVNETGPSRKRLEKPLPFYLDSDDTGKVIVKEDEDVRIMDDPESVVEFCKGMRFKNKKELIKTVNTFCIKNCINCLLHVQWTERTILCRLHWLWLMKKAMIHGVGS
ncbi:hypothetical protein MLD38_011441 [Melastoma candidum]|uniref:Uncharacterized protein n=1 Tax=Melastoma candidum TaxID=119954 RepID=A0ACB9R324_9MYRT|nr:hypothetical protein MLD38_011441 [Melastoma candidum]